MTIKLSWKLFLSLCGALAGIASVLVLPIKLVNYLDQKYDDRYVLQSIDKVAEAQEEKREALAELQLRQIQLTHSFDFFMLNLSIAEDRLVSLEMKQLEGESLTADERRQINYLSSDVQKFREGMARALTSLQNITQEITEEISFDISEEAVPGQ